MRRTISQECSLLAALVLLVIGVFYAIPLAYVLFGSLTSDSGLALNGGGSFVGLANYTRALGDPELRQSILATIAFTAPAVAVQIAFAFAAALLTNRSYPGVSLLRAILIAPYFLPSVVVVIAWRFFADPFVGILPDIFRWAGLTSPDLQGPTAALPVMILVATYEAFPFTYVILLARMMQIPAVLYEVAELDGATPLQRFQAVTWPQIRLTVGGLVLLRALITWLKFDVPWLVYASSAQSPWGDTLAVRIYRLGFQNFQRGDAYAISLVVILAAWGSYGCWVLLSRGRAGRQHRLEQLASGGR